MKLVVAMVLCATSAARAQTPYSGLPAGAFIVEVKEIPVTAHPNRALVLWMLHPKKHDRGPLTEDNAYTCPEVTKGSYFSGPTRISLIDTSAGRVMNTISLDWGASGFEVPYRISSGYYHVPDPLRHGEGKPELLHLRDYNGDGDALEAAFFDAESCVVLRTTLIGYSKKQDQVIQYWLELTEGRKKSFHKWIDHLFSEKPNQPGFWKYEIDYRGRMGNWDRYEIRYDPALERFYGTLKSIAPKR